VSFGSLMRESMTTGSVPFYKAYLRAFIDAVEVDDRVIRIHGSKSPPNKPLSPVIGWEPGKGVSRSCTQMALPREKREPREINGVATFWRSRAIIETQGLFRTLANRMTHGPTAQVPFLEDSARTIPPRSPTTRLSACGPSSLVQATCFRLKTRHSAPA